MPSRPDGLEPVYDRRRDQQNRRQQRAQQGCEVQRPFEVPDTPDAVEGRDQREREQDLDARGATPASTTHAPTDRAKSTPSASASLAVFVVGCGYQDR